MMLHPIAMQFRPIDIGFLDGLLEKSEVLIAA